MSQSNRIQTDDLVIDFDQRRLTRRGEVIRLTRTEWALLGVLIRHPNQVLTHRQLLQQVWGDAYHDESDYVHTYVSRLRRKVEIEPSDPQYIVTEPGIGYRFELPPDTAESHSAEAAIGTPKAATRLVHALPQRVDERYVGRLGERDRLKALLCDDNTRVIGVYGRAGIGKTALVSKVIGDLLTDSMRCFDAVVVMSERTTGLSWQTLLDSYMKVLSPEAQASLQAQLDEGDRSFEQRAAALLDRLSKGRYLLLLDNLETVQNPATGALEDEGLRALIEQATVQGTLSILLTSRYPLALPRPAQTRERRLMLEDGLAEPDVREFLCRCDPDRVTGLCDADDALVAEITVRTQGHPRALEAFVGLLIDNPLMTADELLKNARMFEGEVSTQIVQDIIDRLDADAERVMQLIAMFRTNVTYEMLSTLAATFLEPALLQQTLNRLVKSLFVKYEQIGTARTFSLHPIDQAYCYGRIPDADDGAFNKRQLHLQIAKLYKAEQLPQEKIRRREDVNPHMARFDHLVRAGSYEAAGELLLWLDVTFLTRWGDFAELVRMHESLRGKIQADDLRLSSLLELGEAYRQVGRLQNAMEVYGEVLAAPVKSPQVEALAHSRVGWVEYDFGHFTKATEYLQQALANYEKISDRRGMGITLGGLGWFQYLLGHYEAAETYYQKALDLLESEDVKWGIGMNLGDLGVVRLVTGKLSDGIDKLERALAIADETNDLSEKSYKRSYLATAYLEDGRLADALRVIRDARTFEFLPNLSFVEAVHGLIQARSGQVDDAVTAWLDAREYADELLKTESGLYRVHYAAALAKAGLYLVGQGGVPETDVLEAYQTAIAICSDQGVLTWNRLLLKHLLMVPSERSLTGITPLLE